MARENVCSQFWHAVQVNDLEEQQARSAQAVEQLRCEAEQAKQALTEALQAASMLIL